MNIHARMMELDDQFRDKPRYRISYLTSYQFVYSFPLRQSTDWHLLELSHLDYDDDSSFRYVVAVRVPEASMTLEKG